MTAQEWVFVVLGLIGTIAAIRLVTTREIVHGALYLVVTLSSVAGAYLIMAAEFVAWVQVLIYVGAIVILFLFGLMLTRAPIGRAALDNQQRGMALVMGLIVLGGLSYLLLDAFPWGSSERMAADPAGGTAAALGGSLFREYVLPFEAVSFLLLAALIGAIVLSRKDDRSR